MKQTDKQLLKSELLAVMKNLIMEGMTVNKIADKLDICEKTIRRRIKDDMPSAYQSKARENGQAASKQIRNGMRAVLYR